MSGRPGSHRLTRRRLLAGGALGVGALGATARASGFRPPPIGPAFSDEPAERLGAPVSRRWTTRSIGSSVEGRSIDMHTNVSRQQRTSVMVVSTVHGDERGVAPIGIDLVTVDCPDDVTLNVIPVANPDGWARSTRNNANDVDLNRNFPWWWKAATGGPGPASEPETQALVETVSAVRPDLIVWIHQPLAYIAPIAPGTLPFATAWADACGLPVQRWISQHGGDESWSWYKEGIPSILVEAPTRDDTPDVVEAHRAGFQALLDAI